MIPRLQSTVAKTFGFVFIAIGLLGFFNNPIVGRNALFETNLLHDLVHLASGAAALAMAYASERMAWYYNLIFGATYTLVMLLGFMGVNFIVNLLNINMADNVLHLLIAAGLLGTALAQPERTTHPRTV